MEGSEGVGVEEKQGSLAVVVVVIIVSFFSRSWRGKLGRRAPVPPSPSMVDQTMVIRVLCFFCFSWW